jgi:hypothetical protein
VLVTLVSRGCFTLGHSSSILYPGNMSWWYLRRVSCGIQRALVNGGFKSRDPERKGNRIRINLHLAIDKLA